VIYVTVGTDTHDFSRLLKAMDDIARFKTVVIQTGHSTYQPRHAQWFHFAPTEKITTLFKEADIIVTHAGAGSIMRSLMVGKVPIVVPRLKKFKEHINNHQLDLAHSLGKRKQVVVVLNTDDLSKNIKKRRHKKQTSNPLLKKLEHYLEGLK